MHRFNGQQKSFFVSNVQKLFIDNATLDMTLHNFLGQLPSILFATVLNATVYKYYQIV